MADHSKSGPLETGAPMDYKQAEQTYGWFLSGTKYGVIFCVALMAAMAFGFFVGGWFSGTVLFIILCAAGVIIL
jgi:Bacterial aa3 type cytochrome c oxidase subunit IV